MQVGPIDVNKLSGIGEKFIGLAKELMGTLIGNDNLEQAGQAQQDKGTERLAALRDEIDAARKEAEAEAHEQRQKVAAKSRRTA